MNKGLALLLFSFTASCLAQTQLLIGVESIPRQDEQIAFLEETFNRIKNGLLDIEVIPVYLKSQDLLREARKNRLQGMILTSDLYRELLPCGLRDVATLVENTSRNANRQAGVAILVKSKRSDLINIQCLQNRGVAFLENCDFSERIFRAEMVKELNSKKISFRSHHIKTPYEGLEKLFSGSIDALCLPTCTFERFAKGNTWDTSFIRVLNAKSGDELACQNSTQLYPGTIFALSADVKPDLLMQISQLLFSLPENRFAHWGVATDYRSTDRLLRYLGLDEVSKAQSFSFSRFFQTYKEWILVSAALLLMLCFHSVIVSRLVRRRTRELSEALLRERVLRQEASLASERLERMQRMGIVGQMSSLFAHEIRQPLSALQCYLYMLKKELLAKQSAETSEQVSVCLQRIESQADWIGNVVQKVHSFIKHRSSNRKTYSWKEIVESACATFETTSTAQSEHSFHCHWSENDLLIFCEKMDMELVLINLFRNAVEAKNPHRECRIDIFIETYDQGSRCLVCDNGDTVSDEMLHSLSALQTSSAKPQGLGLGLSIVRFLVEHNAGHVDFFKTQTGGLKVVISMPRLDDMTQQLSKTVMSEVNTNE